MLDYVTDICALSMAQMSVSSRTPLRISVQSYVRHQRSSQVTHVDRVVPVGSCGLTLLQIAGFAITFSSCSVL